MNTQSPHDITILFALSQLGVPTGPASPQFRCWVHNVYPHWRAAETFLEAVPQEWHLVERDDYSLCYLAPESIIMETANRSPGSDLIPIGALMSGAFLVIDTSSDNGQMIVGRVKQHRAMVGECSELDRHSYHSFDLSYSEWLAHVRAAPTDLRYL